MERNMQQRRTRELSESTGGEGIWQAIKRDIKRLGEDMAANARNKAARADIWLVVATVVLLMVGLLMLYSASYAYAHYHENGDSTYYIGRQVLFAVFGLVAMYIASLLPMWFIKKMAYPVLAFAWVLLVIVMLLPPIKGEHRWIDLGFTTFQPSEIGKLAVVLFIARWATDHAMQIKTFRYGVLPYLICVGLTAGLIVIETHLSCFVLICLIAATLMYVGGTQTRWLILAGAGAAGGGLVMIKTVSYMQDRIAAWIDPLAYKLGIGWQNIQSFFAISSGGLLGQGLGNSRQKYLYISEPQNDFIFAVVAEELGFVGSAIVICLFIFFVWRGLTVSMANSDRFARLLGIGITAQIGWQTILNIAVVTGALPNTGISLPFFSYGGTALLMLLGSVGLLLAVSRNASNKAA